MVQSIRFDIDTYQYIRMYSYSSATVGISQHDCYVKTNRLFIIGNWKKERMNEIREHATYTPSKTPASKPLM